MGAGIVALPDAVDPGINEPMRVAVAIETKIGRDANLDDVAGSTKRVGHGHLKERMLIQFRVADRLSIDRKVDVRFCGGSCVSVAHVQITRRTGIDHSSTGDTMMDRQRRDEIELRLKEINTELAAIAEMKVVPGDPTGREEHLLDELDALEFELGIGHFRPSKWRPKHQGS